MDNFDEYMESLLLVIHLGTGMPARATELETYRLISGQSCRRSVYYVDGLVMFLSEYNKTRSVSKANKAIARFLDEQATIFLLNDLLIIRPFVCSIAHFLGLNENNVYATHVFVHRGEKMEAPKLRNIFSRMFFQHGKHSITFAEYRHLAKHYALQLKIEFAWKHEEEEMEEAGAAEEGCLRDWETAESEQFGHNKTTANSWYALLHGELSTMRRHLIEQHRMVSLTWHRFLRGALPSCQRKHHVQETIQAVSQDLASPVHKCDTQLSIATKVPTLSACTPSMQRCDTQLSIATNAPTLSSYTLSMQRCDTQPSTATNAPTLSANTPSMQHTFVTVKQSLL